MHSKLLHHKQACCFVDQLAFPLCSRYRSVAVTADCSGGRMRRWGERGLIAHSADPCHLGRWFRSSLFDAARWPTLIKNRSWLSAALAAAGRDNCKGTPKIGPKAVESCAPNAERQHKQTAWDVAWRTEYLHVTSERQIGPNTVQANCRLFAVQCPATYCICWRAICVCVSDKPEGNVPILPRGFHTFPFRFQLPESSLPCSFESKASTIRYYIKVSVLPQAIKVEFVYLPTHNYT